MWANLQEMADELGIAEGGDPEAARAEVLQWLKKNKDSSPDAHLFVEALIWLDERYLNAPRAVVPAARAERPIDPGAFAAAGPLAEEATPSVALAARLRRKRWTLGGAGALTVVAGLWAASNPENPAFSLISPFFSDTSGEDGPPLPYPWYGYLGNNVWLGFVQATVFLTILAIIGVAYRRLRLTESFVSDLNGALGGLRAHQTAMRELSSDMSHSGFTLEKAAAVLAVGTIPPMRSRWAIDEEWWLETSHVVVRRPGASRFRITASVAVGDLALEAASAMVARYSQAGVLDHHLVDGEIRYTAKA